MNLSRPGIVSISLFLLASCFGLILLFSFSLYGNSVTNRIEAFTVRKGESIADIARELDNLQILDNHFYTIFLIKIMNLEKKIKAGIYEFDVGESRKEVLEKLTYGRQKLFRLTFLEGSTYRQIEEKIKTSRYLKEALVEKRFIENFFDFETRGIEGLFFPDTYFYMANTKSTDILKLASKRMASVIKTEWSNRSSSIEKVIKNPYEALILASIVEKEAVLSSEKPLIAGVFIKRLQNNMRLQADPTVIYAIGDRYNGNIKRFHLKIDSPYNTYRKKGLPPTPIGAPGQDALRAVLNPLLLDYLYFVSKNDGSHKFSKTLEEHNQAVDYYQKRKKQ